MKVKKLKFGGIRDTYSINEYGEIVNTKRDKVVKPHLDKDGYVNISLSTEIDGQVITKRYRVATLVISLFKAKKPFEGATVNHEDGNKLNNHYSNLEWLTSRENYEHACKNNLNPKGFTHGRAIIDEDQLKDICISLLEGESQSSIAKRLNLVPSKISKIRNKENWKDFSDKYFIISNGKLKSI